MGAFAEKLARARSGYTAWYALSIKRAHVIKHKGIFGLAIIAFASIFPEPTKETTRLSNTHILIDKKAKFFRCYTNRTKIPLMQAMWKILIFEYEHDGDMSDLLNWIIGEIKESDWKPRLENPKNFWKIGKDE